MVNTKKKVSTKPKTKALNKALVKRSYSAMDCGRFALFFSSWKDDEDFIKMTKGMNILEIAQFWWDNYA